MAKKFILSKIITHIDLDTLQHTEKNYKGRLIEWGQKNNASVEFDTLENNNQKQRIFSVKVVINSEIKGHAEHISKKKAEQLAAENACEVLAIKF